MLPVVVGLAGRFVATPCITQSASSTCLQSADVGNLVLSSTGLGLRRRSGHVAVVLE